MTKNIKDNLKKLLIMVPLVLLATGVFAAYSFVGPTQSPTGGNTDGPIDTSSSNQIKNGGLAVNAFQVVTGSQFSQQSQFTGLVNGGTANATNSTITFGSSSDKTSINNTGSTAIAGYYQSDSLKTGGGVKPLCADTKGSFYICGTAPASNVNPIYVSSNIQNFSGSGYFAGASLSEPTNANVTVTLSATGGAGVQPSAINFIKNQFTAHAVAYGVCYYNATPKEIGSVTINGGSTASWNTVPLPAGCNPSNTNVFISSYSPHTTMGGRPITVQ